MATHNPTARESVTPHETPPQNAASLALVTVNPYAYRAALARETLTDFVLVAFALTAVGFALIFRARLARFVRGFAGRARHS